VNDNKIVSVSSIVTDIAFVLTFKIGCMYIAWSLYFKIFFVSFLSTILFPEIIMSIKRFPFITRD